MLRLLVGQLVEEEQLRLLCHEPETELTLMIWIIDILVANLIGLVVVLRGLADLVCVVFVQHLDGLIELLLLVLLEGDEVAQIQLVLAVLQGAIVVHIVYLRGQARQTEQEVRLHHIHLRIHI